MIEVLSRQLDTDGDGTGTKNAIGNYSGAEEQFYIQPPAGEVYHIYRMIVAIEDGGPLSSAGYAGITPTAALTNGVGLSKRRTDDTVIVDLMDGDPVVTNGLWAQWCHDLTLHGFGAGNAVLTARWTFNRMGRPIWLFDNTRLVITLEDDFSTVVGHKFIAEGLSMTREEHELEAA